MGLSLSETKKTLNFIRSIKEAGKSAIFIDHNIFHVYPVVDRIIILDRGSIAASLVKDEIPIENLMEGLQHLARTGSWSA